MLRTVYLMVTPRVVHAVREHFACATLEGAELEDQGGDGTAFTHWEKRIFQNEAMTGTVHTAQPAYSMITLALLEDSGWYVLLNFGNTAKTLKHTGMFLITHEPTL